ncbi:MAG TPA: HupE/UreJ family protein [Chitinophagaceae bacterium]|nr:HupE/UreJ family protein [Chitinophagaceae bacterium]
MKLVKQKKYVFILIVIFFPLLATAHNINYALEKAPHGEVVWFYLKLGYEHILPYGIDHILFIVGLCLLSTRFKPIFWQATAFTVAHSITLALSMKSVVTIPSAIVEPVIALSIMFVAIENLLIKELKPWRILIVFFFGLIHGLGFASALNEIGLPRNRFISSILSFNGGVELGQISVILGVFLLIIIPFGKKPWYRKYVVYPLSALIAIIAGYWTVSRLLV